MKNDSFDAEELIKDNFGGAVQIFKENAIWSICECGILVSIGIAILISFSYWFGALLILWAIKRTIKIWYDIQICLAFKDIKKHFDKQDEEKRKKFFTKL